jgi:Glycosyltransferase 61
MIIIALQFYKYAITVMNFTPLKQKFLKLLQIVLDRNISDLRAMSSSRWEISPVETSEVPAAIYLRHHIDKVTALGDATCWEVEMKRVGGGLVEHAATVAYVISKCELLGGSLYKGPSRLPLTRERPSLMTFNQMEYFDQAVLASTYYGSFYFGHWLKDDLSLYLAAEKLGKPIKPARKPYGHEPGYLDLLNIQLQELNTAYFENLILIDDFGQNSYKFQRYLELRLRLQKSSIPMNEGGRVMIRRGQQGAARHLTNAAEIEQLLESHGFVIVDPEVSTVAEIVSATLGARLIVSVEGSHIAHCFYSMAQSGGICILQPPFRFNNVLKSSFDCIGVKYGFVVGDQTEGGFSIDSSDLLSILDKIDAAIG